MNVKHYQEQKNDANTYKYIKQEKINILKIYGGGTALSLV
jgi:hypothetical protein